MNAAADNGILTADVTNGLAPGVYRLASINSAANHQPGVFTTVIVGFRLADIGLVLVAIAQHGSLDDAVYVSCVVGCIRIVLILLRRVVHCSKIRRPGVGLD